jgi:hypothetical protein
VYIYFYGDSYAYVSSNVITRGSITNFNNAKSALDSGAYAIIKEGSTGGAGGNEYLYVDFWGLEKSDWSTTGSPPHLNAVDGSNRIYTNTGNDQQGDYTFDDSSVSGVFSSSQIELYSYQEGAGETINVFIHDGSSWNDMGSISPDSGYSWKSIDTSSVLDTSAKIDAAKMYVIYQKSGAGGVVHLDCARIYWSTVSDLLYLMDVEFNTSSVSGGSNYYLQLNYSVDGSETDFGVLVYDGSSWDDLSSQGDLTSTSFSTKEYTLDSDHRLSDGSVRVRFIGRNETSDIVQSTLNIEYHRIKSSDSFITLTGEGVGDLFGWSVANISDINQDGSYDDVIVGAPFINDDWWNSNWQYRKKLTFDNGLQSETLVNFPVLVNLSSSNFEYTNAKSDGSDLRFIDADGTTELSYHIEDWDTSAYSDVWVNVTSIDGSSSTDYIWMYYGNSAASDVRDVEGTYSVNYTGIWHLNETSGTPYDSTTYDNDGTVYNGVTQGVTGQVDLAADFAGSSGVDDYIDCGNDASLSFDVTRNYTYSTWIYRHANADWDEFFCVLNYNSYGFRAFVDGSTYLNVGNHTNSRITGTTSLSINTWYHVAVVFNSSAPTVPEIYLNGNKETTSGSGTFLSDTADPFLIGYGWTVEAFDGVLDEVRASNILRSADWISAQYNSMINNFITFGSEQQRSQGKAYIFHGGSSMDSVSDVNLTGENYGDRFGYSVDFAGDVDGDGRNDVIVGAPYYDNASYTNSGNTYVFKGGSSMNFVAHYDFMGSQANEHMGWSVSFALDINDSSDNAVVAGAPHRDDGSNTDCGKGYVLYIRIPQIVINEIMINPTGGPWDEDWNFRKKITIHSSKVWSNLTDFPVLISTIDSDLKDKAQSDGDDILFIGADNETKYDHEIEKYDSSTGELVAWVKIPSISSVNDTVFYMYYNNSDAVNQENEEGVWSNGYVSVYHMEEDTGSIGNSASSTNDGARVNTPTRDTGKIGYAQNFTGGGADDYFNLGDLGLADGTNENFTISTWANINNPGVEDWGKIVSKRNNSDTGMVYSLGFDNDGTSKEVYIYVNDDGSSGIPIIKSNWVFMSFTYNGSSQMLYYNDTLELEDTGMSGPMWSSTADVTIGVRKSPMHNYAGLLDELRFSNVARSAEWIATEYNNQYYPDTFYTINGEDINSSAWTYRKEITINNEKVTGDIDGFPMLIQTTDSDLSTYAQSDGDDIIFTDWDGKSQLHHEIENYSSSSGNLIAWVKMASLSSSSDTTIYMYYNNSDATNSQNDEGVWSNGYVGVYHLTEESGVAANSATSTHDGTRYDSPTRIAGRIDYGQDFSGVAGDDRFNLGDMDLTNGVQVNLTLSFWMYADNSIIEDWGRLINKRDNADSNTVWGVNFDSDPVDKDISFYCGDEGGGYAVGKSVWVYATYTYDGANKIHYRNGSWARDDTGGSGPISTTISQAPVTIGARWGGSASFGGILDEVRISKVTHSAGWISTEYNNQNNPGSFYTFNDEDITPSDWSYRKPITINSSEVTGDLFAFPILVNITDSDLANDARADGYDIIFTDSGGESKLCHEIENYTSSSGELIAWVKVPRVSSSSDTTIYMYYGDSSISSPTEEPNQVWNSNFKGVWHLSEDPSGSSPQFNDSTANNNDGTANSLTTSNQVQGKIDGSLEFDDTNERHVNVSDDASLRLETYIMVSAWVNTTDTEADVGIIAAKWGSIGNRNYWLGKINAASIAFYVDDTQSVTADLSLINDGFWHHVVGVADVDNSLLRIYVDGIQRNTAAYSGSSEMGTEELHIGNSPDSASQEYDGRIDEVRVSNKIRGTDWINASFSNQNDTASFLYAGSEESPPSSTTESTVNYEWVELYNAGNYAVNLTGWTLDDNDGNTFDLSGAGTIPVGGYLVCHLGESGTNSTTDVYGPIIRETTIIQAIIQPDTTASKDSYLNEPNPNTNYGGENYLYIENWTGTGRRPIIQFNLSSVLTSDIIDANVWLYRHDGTTTEPTTINVHRVTQSWTEAGSDWDTYDGTNDWPVANDGGDYDSTIEDSNSVLDSVNAWYDWDISDLIQEWKDGTYENYGMLFEASADSYWHQFRSSDYVTDPSLRPKLIVNYNYTPSSSFTMLGNSDDLSLVKSDSVIIDYVAWGEDPGGDDDAAVSWEQWTDGEYVDTSDLLENQTIGRDLSSNDTDLPADWENGSGKADPFGIDRSTENGSTPNAQNVDVIIPEYDEILFPIIFMLIMIAVWRRKWRQNKGLQKNERIQEKNATRQDTEITQEKSRIW